MPCNWPRKFSTTCVSTPKPHFLIVAGDPSGDQHAAALVKALKAEDSETTVSALGGVHLRAVADRFIYPLVDVGGFGFWEPLFKLPALWQARRKIQHLLVKDKINAVIPIDYYGFNIHTARLAHGHAIPVIYFISPQVWASRPYRIQALAKVLTKMLVIFPFEVELYRKAGVPVSFVGHPLLDVVPEPVAPSSRLSIGLLPGSRWNVIKRHLSILKETARRLRDAFPEATFSVFRPAEIEAERYQPFLSDAPWLILVYDPTYEQRKTLTLAIGVSGTAALENTLLGVPMIVMYKLSSLTYALAKWLIKIPFIAIPNILAGKKIVPEWLQEDAEPETLAREASRLLKDSTGLQKMRKDLLAQRERLGQRGAVQAAAREIRKVIQG